jgi:hypothetical protein
MRTAEQTVSSDEVWYKTKRHVMLTTRSGCVAHDSSGVVQHLAEGESGGRGQFGCVCMSYRAQLTSSYHVGVACACFAPGINVAWEPGR